MRSACARRARRRAGTGERPRSRARRVRRAGVRHGRACPHRARGGAGRGPARGGLDPRRLRGRVDRHGDEPERRHRRSLLQSAPRRLATRERPFAELFVGQRPLDDGRDVPLPARRRHARRLSHRPDPRPRREHRFPERVAAPARHLRAVAVALRLLGRRRRPGLAGGGRPAAAPLRGTTRAAVHEARAGERNRGQPRVQPARNARFLVRELGRSHGLQRTCGRAGGRGHRAPCEALPACARNRHHRPGGADRRRLLGGRGSDLRRHRAGGPSGRNLQRVAARGGVAVAGGDPRPASRTPSAISR